MRRHIDISLERESACHVQSNSIGSVPMYCLRFTLGATPRRRDEKQHRENRSKIGRKMQSHGKSVNTDAMAVRHLNA